MGHKCKLMRSKTPRVGDKCGTQVEDKCKLMRPNMTSQDKVNLIRYTSRKTFRKVALEPGQTSTIFP